MFDFLARALAACYDVWPSYGGSIALLTLAIMLVLTPLSIKSTRSMIKMQRLQPELKRLQAQYKGDREALNREMMAFYQANNVNPVSSCLPMLLQLPVFFVLYRILHGLTRINPKTGDFAPNYLDHSSALFRALSKVNEMNSFGIDLSRSSLKALSDSGLAAALPYFVMIAIVAGTTFYQQRQIQGRNPSAAAANPQQQMISKIVPFIMIPITVSVPAGVVIYFVISNLVRVGQQGLITYLEYRDTGDTPIVRPAPTKVDKGDKAPKNDKSGAKPTKPARPAAAPKPSGRVTPARSSANRPQNRKRKRK
jgi:YidC/Oxa1 family membrane protein insertase